MPINIGGNSIDDIRIGDTAVDFVFIGQTEIYPLTPVSRTISAHSLSQGSGGAFTQTVTGEEGAMYTTTLEAGTHTIPAGGTNTHAGSVTTQACSSVTGSATIQAGDNTVINVDVQTTVSTVFAQTGATGTTIGTYVNEGSPVYGACSAPSSGADPANPCSATTTTTGTQTGTQLQRAPVTNNCDGSSAGTTTRTVAAPTLSCSNTSATNTSFVAGNTEDSGVAGPFVGSGTCTPTDTSVGCCPDATCTGQPGTESGTITTTFTTTRNCDGAFVSSREEVANTSQACNTASYPNPDTCGCTGGSVTVSAVTLTGCGFFGANGCSFTVNSSNNLVVTDQAQQAAGFTAFFGTVTPVVQCASNTFAASTDTYYHPAETINSVATVCSGTGRRVPAPTPSTSGSPVTGCSQSVAFTIS